MAWALLAGGSAMAAGGHHAVDDAVILDPGQCELETWAMRSHAGERLAHVGPGCRVGPVELAAVLEGSRQAGQGASAQSVQLKAVHAVGHGWSVGAAVAPFWRQPAQERGATVLLLATWVAGDWTAHANLGRDFIRHGAGQARSGAALEYAFNPQWSAIGERYSERGTAFARAGARWTVSPAWTLDLTHAHRLHGPGASAWTLGSTWNWQR